MRPEKLPVSMQMLVAEHEGVCRKIVIISATVLFNLVKRVEIIADHPLSLINEKGKNINQVKKKIIILNDEKEHIT